MLKTHQFSITPINLLIICRAVELIVTLLCWYPPRLAIDAICGSTFPCNSLILTFCCCLKKCLCVEGGIEVVAKTATPQQNAPETANPCPKSLKTETVINVCVAF